MNEKQRQQQRKTSTAHQLAGCRVFHAAWRVQQAAAPVRLKDTQAAAKISITSSRPFVLRPLVRSLR